MLHVQNNLFVIHLLIFWVSAMSVLMFTFNSPPIGKLKYIIRLIATWVFFLTIIIYANYQFQISEQEPMKTSNKYEVKISDNMNIYFNDGDKIIYADQIKNKVTLYIMDNNNEECYVNIENEHYKVMLFGVKIIVDLEPNYNIYLNKDTYYRLTKEGKLTWK